MAEYTPMMKQYLSIKENYQDAILFYRIGDFYEMFFDDAKKASAALDLVLTGKNCGQEERAPMCGVPFHSCDSYIAKLVSKGYKVAICEQVEDPATAKGLVKRDVIRILTPGTVIEDSMLEEGKNNYLACIYRGDGRTGLSFVDVSTGEAHVTEVSESEEGEETLNELGRFMPREILVNAQGKALKGLEAFTERNEGIYLETLPDSDFDSDNAERLITDHFDRSLQELNLNSENAVKSFGTALSYLMDVQKTDLAGIRNVNFYSDSRYMKLDFTARRNLELTETMRNREKRGTLLWVLDRTKTAMGKRLLRSWLEQPLVSEVEILKRQRAVTYLTENLPVCDEITGYLTGIHDMERLITRISYGTANARELRSLRETVSRLMPVKELLQTESTNLLMEIEESIDPLTDVLELIDMAIVPEPPFSVREGDMIADGFSPELDELRDIVRNGKGYLAKIEAAEKERTGITKLKIGYNKVFGYYLEVPNSVRDQVPEDYIRKQTLTNSERFITGELKELESKVLGAQERISKLEYEIFSGVREEVGGNLSRIQETSHAIATLDALCSFAHVAVQNGYTAPDIVESGTIEIKEGRHPVVEKVLKGAPFVPNDTVLDNGENQVALITGPNMAGKSTYMRQVALIVIMAQIGSFVPAESARIGICDSIFTRVGASDDLAGGQSTFMVEMSEVATILKNATKDSLIILDEIGRGTSTFDGMSIAKAVLEYIADPSKIGAKTLFATHYHELTEMETESGNIKNYNIACKKRGKDILFLRRIVRGPADGSYGIEVAHLAGVPEPVVERAHKVLEYISEKQEAIDCLLASEKGEEIKKRMEEREAASRQVTFADSGKNRIIDELKTIDPATLTPIEAMNTLYELCKEAGTIEE